VLIAERPLFTREYENSGEFDPESNSVYLYGVTSEPRSEFAIDLMSRNPDIKFVELRETASLAFETDLPGFEHIFIRRRSILEEFVKALPGSSIYLDITGLSHSTWAPLVKVCVELNRIFRVIYLEPATYSMVSGPDSGDIFDLSEQIDGIAPIPLFTTLANPVESEATFVALLGFEGVRFSHMLNEMQPDPSRIFPVIGVPGFRLHYPFDAYIGNALSLDQYKAARNLNFAKSNCPFSLFYALEDVAARHPSDHMRIGLIGTKPHALGAILFAISRPHSVEIVYDHVKRKTGRTRGAARCLVYGISEFLTPDRRVAA
jgi:hypothetical protein